MRVWSLFWSVLALNCLPGFAADPEFDFTKAPGGGVEGLRACAQYAYHPQSRAGSVYSLGCETIACVCRPDLIQTAHDVITEAVVANCGKDATVDIEAAIKLYNDYCSANGYEIPGYTYIITTTMQRSTAPDTNAATTPSSTAAIVDVASPGSEATTTFVGAIPTATEIVTVTVASGASRQLRFSRLKKLGSVAFGWCVDRT